MATIQKRGEYSYQAIVRRRGFPTQTKTFETKTDAQKWARKIERDMDRGAWCDTSIADSMTLGDVLRRYLETVTPHKRGADVERYKINAILRDPICTLRMSGVSSAVISDWRDRRLKCAKGSTVTRELAIITHAIEIARKEWGVLMENPCALVRRPPPSKARERRLSTDEQCYLVEALGATKSPYVKPMTLLGIESAMRRSELLGLRWEDVNLERRFVYLAKTKNGSSRFVPLSSVAVDVLRALPISPCGRVFPLSMEAFKQAYVRSVERARKQYREECIRDGIAPDPRFLTDLRFHDMRHEATSRLFERGLNVMEVASVTGHKTLQMLQRYTHLRAEDIARKLE